MGDKSKATKNFFVGLGNQGVIILNDLFRGAFLPVKIIGAPICWIVRRFGVENFGKSENKSGVKKWIGNITWGSAFNDLLSAVFLPLEALLGVLAELGKYVAALFGGSSKNKLSNKAFVNKLRGLT